MSASVLPRMTADEFIAWATGQPEGNRYELVAGEVFAMAPQRSGHALAAFAVARRLAEAVEAGKLPCVVYGDGMPIQVDATTIYEPDAMVRCGGPLSGDAVKVTDPLIVVEVLSPSSRAVDTSLKFTDYFRITSVRHYLIVRSETRTIIHHRRDEAGTILTRIIRDGSVALDPPGLVLDGVFPAASAG